MVEYTGQQKKDLDVYEALLKKWQRTINLVAASTLDNLWIRHFRDSAQLLTLAPHAVKWLDLGSGGGFPGLVIAVLLKGTRDAHVDLVESDTRKAAFLRTVSRETGAPASVHADRLETVLSDLPQPEIITARALASLPRLLEWTGGMIENGATGLFLKGQDVDVELNDSAICSRFKIEKFPSRTDPRAQIVKVTKP